MQKVAAYLLERREAMSTPEARASAFESARGAVDEWLRSKGADVTQHHGPYTSEDGSMAAFEAFEEHEGGRRWWMVRLDETTGDGRVTRASLSVTLCADRVAVYAALEIGGRSTSIKPVVGIARCPRVIRDLLALPVAWHHGASLLQPLARVDGFENGERLAGELLNPERTIPIVALSTEQGELAAPRLDTHIERDLSGLANVVVVDPDASWALTDVLGQSYSCFDGAVRLYWPRFSLDADPFDHPLWLAARIRSAPTAGSKPGGPLRDRLRVLVMQASALGVVRPPEIDELKRAADRRRFEELRNNADSTKSVEELANQLFQANEELTRERDEKDNELRQANARIRDLEHRITGLTAQLSAARQVEEPDDPAAPAEAPAQRPPPKRGEIRYYKKKYDTGQRDVLVEISDCEHNRWQSAKKAPKARKGLLHLEKQEELDVMWHCGACKGGGVWKVRW